ncbi:uncharacterized protein LOC108628697 [Ceratina calcarata]|uniref:Uncharacterized protein LOC108628697 n=1 Tax=Ceratina calcarata TaxID=156304 RepID=A0AAJ7S720_9HYME|nr:uncharacterized protein LOC108628697 [Ceratina calcarata]
MPPPACPGLTKTEQLRRARTQAALREHDRREQALARHEPEPFRSRPRRPARPEPKKVDFTRPGLTKAMIAKLKHSEKFKQELERKAEATLHTRVPKRTPAPIGGDARAGRERSVPRVRRTPATSRGPSPGPSQVPRATTPRMPVPRRTAELARMMNADVVQAEPVGTGPIENIVIPSGLVSDRPTIVNITPPAETSPAEGRIGMDMANQSIQVINQSLDEQDAVESAAVNNRLTDLQNARREFVIAVANVGGNAIHLEDEQPEIVEPLPISPLRPTTPVVPESPPAYVRRVPVIEEPAYGFDHPDVVAAMEHLRRIREEMRARDAHRRLEEEFARIQAETDAANVPIFEEVDPDPAYEYPPFDPDELGRFFDVQRYPTPCGHCGGPPPERAHLPQDLWELEDPWARPPPEPDVPDLIQFD